jgi:hypothetical protein
MDEIFEKARAELPHVYWVGGPGCSGKSSVARLLAAKYDLRIYHVDDESDKYEVDLTRLAPEWHEIDFLGKSGKPAFHLSSPELARYVIAIFESDFVQTLRDLLSWPRDKGVIVEGVFLPPLLLQVAPPGRIAIMVSSRAFRQQYFDHRHEWFAAYADKEAAFQTVLGSLDVMDQRWLNEIAHHAVYGLTIDSPQAIASAATQLAAHFALANLGR